jgi:ribosomal protein S18 acetylase RimI-like enzyme
MIEIIEINYQATFSVRHPILREGKPIENCYFEGDEIETTKHFGLFVDKKIVGVVSVYINKNTNFKTDNQFQIRGMAVLKNYQMKGFGDLLVNHCENYVREQNGHLIWFNAREIAVGFYEKLNYVKYGDPFLIADVGIHFKMYKKLM